MPASIPSVGRLVPRLREGMDVLAREAVKFGAVGAVAFVVDVGLFNLLRYGLGGGGPLEGSPLKAKILSVTAATIVAWLGNRYWTFRHRRRTAIHHELLLFVVFNAVGMAIAVACLGISYYGLHLRSALADNISANVIGLGLGTLFRFWAYRRFVFTNELGDLLVHDEPSTAPPAGGTSPAAETAPSDERPATGLPQH